MQYKNLMYFEFSKILFLIFEKITLKIITKYVMFVHHFQKLKTVT
jgi:hypothetical protein